MQSMVNVGTFLKGYFVDSGLFFFLALASAIVFASYAYSVAEAKGHDGSAWGLGGFFLGPVALLASLGLPDLKTRKYLRAPRKIRNPAGPSP